MKRIRTARSKTLPGFVIASECFRLMPTPTGVGCAAGQRRWREDFSVDDGNDSRESLNESARARETSRMSATAIRNLGENRIVGPLPDEVGEQP